SRWFRAEGWHVVNMTQYPEAYLARELGMHYAGIALVTDYDTGVEHDAGVAPVTQEQVFAFFEANLHHVRALLDDLLPRLGAEPLGPRAGRRGGGWGVGRGGGPARRMRGVTGSRAPSPRVPRASAPAPPVRAGDDRQARGLARRHERRRGAGGLFHSQPPGQV